MSAPLHLSRLRIRAARVGLDLHELDDGALRIDYAAFGEAGHLYLARTAKDAAKFIGQCEIELREFIGRLDGRQREIGGAQ